MAGSDLLFDARRQRLARAAKDGERLYRKRMHDEPTIADDNRINGILTLDLVDALGFVDELLAALASRPVSLAQTPEEDIAGRLVAEGEPSPAHVSDGVIPRRLNDLADADKGGAVEPSDGDFNPVADVELHYPIVAREQAVSYADELIRCGICGNCWGCACMEDDAPACGATSWQSEGFAICRAVRNHDGRHVWEIQ